MSFLKNQLNLILSLPSVSERKDISKSFFAKITSIGFSTKEKDDLYIYSQNGKSSIIISLILGLAFIISYIANVDLIAPYTKSSHVGSIHSTVYQYNQISFVILFFLVYPFFLLKYRWNINPKKHDVLWIISKYNKAGSREKIQILKSYALIWIVGFVILKFGHYFALFIPQFIPVADNLFGLLFCYLILSWMWAVGSQGILFATIVFWRYLGNHEGQ